MSYVKVGGGRMMSVKPKAAVTPLVVVTMTEAGGKDWRSRPGLEPPVFGDIAVEGIEDVLAKAVASA